MHKFSLRFWCGYLHQPKNITTIPYHFISTLLNANFDFDVSVANEVAIDVAKCALQGKVMQWSPCPEVRTLTNENGRYMIINEIKWLFCYQKDISFFGKTQIRAQNADLVIPTIMQSETKILL